MRKERDFNIREMLKRGEHKDISYCPIYASGEYGARTEVPTREEKTK